MFDVLLIIVRPRTKVSCPRQKLSQTSCHFISIFLKTFTMGLISKIEDKLTGAKHEPNYDSGTTSNTTSSNASKLQNPISSGAGPTGTAVSGTSRDGYGSSGLTSGHTGNTASGQSSSTSPAGHTTQTSSSINPSTTTSTHTTTNSDRQTYDPYSSKGQSSAMSTGVPPLSNTSGTRAAYEDPSIARGHQGGILNSSQGYGNPSASQQQPSSTTSSATRQPETSASVQPGMTQPQTTSSSHHYGRDAGIVGGAGAAGVGAYEMGKHSGQTSSSSAGYPTDHATSPSHQYTPGTATSTAPGANPGSTSAAHGQGMGAAYEAGYRDGYEAAKKEIMMKLNQ
jgi:hypothetical protein